MNGDYEGVGRRRFKVNADQHVVSTRIARRRPPHERAVDQPTQGRSAHERVSIDGLAINFTGKRNDQNIAREDSTSERVLFRTIAHAAGDARRRNRPNRGDCSGTSRSIARSLLRCVLEEWRRIPGRRGDHHRAHCYDYFFPSAHGLQYIKRGRLSMRPIIFHRLCLIAAAAAACGGPMRAEAQHAAERDTSLIRVFVDGEPEAVVRAGRLENVQTDAEALVDSLRARGRYFAAVDSMVDGELFVSSGPLIRVGRIAIEGIDSREADAMRLEMDTRIGRILEPSVLEDDLRRILTSFDTRGYALAEVSIEEIGSMEDGSISLTLRIKQGPQVRLERIELPGADRTSASFVSRLVGYDVGGVLGRYEPELIRRRLEETGLFETVGPPELVIEPDSAAVLMIPLVEAAPGNFDLVIGYLPPQTPGDAGSLVGNGRLELRNVVGGGRRISIRLNRLPNQVSSVDVRASDPFLFRMPLGLEGRFQGLEQDSTYGKQSYRGEIAYRFERGLSAFVGFSREVTRPGQAGLRLSESGRQVIPRSDAWFLGLGVRMENVDRHVNPTRGYFVETNLESGRKEFIDRRVVGSDTSSIVHLMDQRRLQASGRLYVPTFSRQVLVVGGEGGLLLSDTYDRSDLFRFGGATSLRGYDEDQFLGRIVARALAEYRLLIDRDAFAYLFFDLGYVDRPEAPDLAPSRAVRPGYGVGIQFRSALGLINVSAALNPDSGPTEARIHAGLSFGL